MQSGVCDLHGEYGESGDTSDSGGTLFKESVQRHFRSVCYTILGMRAIFLAPLGALIVSPFRDPVPSHPIRPIHI